jgi:hypothetical protein
MPSLSTASAAPESHPLVRHRWISRAAPPPVDLEAGRAVASADDLLHPQHSSAPPCSSPAAASKLAVSTLPANRLWAPQGKDWKVQGGVVGEAGEAAFLQLPLGGTALESGFPG